MSEPSIFLRVKALCDETSISVNSLITEISGSSGNLPTWKKGHIRSDWLAAICLKFNVSADYILGISKIGNQNIELSFAERFDALDEEGKTVVTSAIIHEERRIKHE